MNDDVVDAILIGLALVPVAFFIWMKIPSRRALPADIAPSLDPDARAAPAPSATGAPLSWPLFVYGHHDAEEWLLPPRAFGRSICFVDLADPHNGKGEPLRDALAEAASMLLAEWVWLHTDLEASAAVFVVLDQKRVLTRTSTTTTFDELSPFLASLSGDVVAAFGVAEADMAGSGASLTLRSGSSERTMRATVPELRERVVAWLVSQRRATKCEPPAWYRAPTSLEMHAMLLHDLRLQILADRKNRAIAPLTPDMHEGFVDLAFDAVAEMPNTVLELLALTTAHYAARAGALSERQRARALRHLDGVIDTASPIYRLSPNLYRSFGLAERAEARRLELLATAEGKLRAWLENLPKVWTE